MKNNVAFCEFLKETRKHAIQELSATVQYLTAKCSAQR